MIRMRITLLLLAMALFVSGCFGLFNNKAPVVPDLPEPTVSLNGTLTGPGGLAGASGSVASHWEALGHAVASLMRGPVALAATSVISGEAALQNTPIRVYDLHEYVADPAGAVAIKQTVTDADGKYTVTDIPKHKDLIIVTDTTPRLSVIVPATQHDATADVNSATTLVTEAWAESLQNGDTAFIATDYNGAVQQAQSDLDALNLDEDGLLSALEQLIPATTGDGLQAPADPDLQGVVQTIEASVPQAGVDRYSVAGRVVNDLEQGVADVEIAFSGGFSSVYTDIGGYWSKDGLYGEVVIEAVSNVVFEADAEYGTYTVDEEEMYVYLTGRKGIFPRPVANEYSITGTVLFDDGSPATDVELIVHGHGEHAVTDAQGRFTVADIGVATVLEPVSDDYIFDPPHYIIDAAADVQFVASDAAGMAIQFDPHIDFAVRNELGPDFWDPDVPLFPQDVSSVLVIRSNGLEINTLDGVEHLENLRVLELFADDYGTNNISDLSPLADLQHLEAISIDYSHVSDIAPLAGKENITSIGFAYTQVSDLSPVRTLPQLESLYMPGTPIADLSPLEGLSHIESLYVHDTAITNLDVIPSLTGLDSLMANNALHLTDITALANTTAEWINISNTPSVGWCEYETWEIIESLRADGKNVTSDNVCEGPYTVIVHQESAGSYTPPIELEIQDDQGHWTAELGRGVPTELQVEGEAVIRPVRVLDEWDHVWRFDPEFITVDGPVPEQSIRMYETEDHIVEGYITDEFGNPLNVDEVVMTYGTNNERVSVTTDENGYFVYEFPHLTTVEVQPKKANWVFTPAVSDRLTTPRRFHFTGEEQTVWMAYATDEAIYVQSGDGVAGHTVVDGLIDPAFDVSPDGTHIVYSSGQAGNRAVYVVHADGTGNRLLTGSETYIDASFPSWSMFDDIVYSRRRTDGPEPARNPARLHVTSPAGGEGEPISSTGEANEHRMYASWSPDGDTIVYSVTPTSSDWSASGIFTMRSDGTDRTGYDVEGVYPVFSPDGNRIAYEHDGDVHIIDVATKQSSLLIADARRPAWSPDGQRIAFVRDDMIYTIDAQATGTPEFITHGTALVWLSQ